MQTCKTCKHWQQDKRRDCTICFPYHPGTLDQLEDEDAVVALFGHRVRECKHPKVLFYQRPEIDGAAVVDGSEYAASLLTAEQFGCVLHEAVAEIVTL